MRKTILKIFQGVASTLLGTAGQFLICVSLLCQFHHIALADNQFGNPIVDAADRGDIGKIMQLIQSHQNINTPGKFGSTALMRAVYHGNHKLIKVLLNAGANVNSQDIAGTTALHIAARQGYANILNMLLENGSIVDVVDYEGFTPLMRAVSANRLEATKILLQHQADANVVNNFNQSAIKLATNKSPLIKTLFGINEPKATPALGKPITSSTPAPTAAKPIINVKEKIIIKDPQLKLDAQIVSDKKNKPTPPAPTTNKVRVGKAIKIEGALPKLAVLTTPAPPAEVVNASPHAESKKTIVKKDMFYMYIKGFADEKAAVDFWYWAVSGAQFAGKDSKLMVNKVTTPHEHALRLAYYPVIKDVFHACRKVREKNRSLYCYAVPVVLTK